MKREGANTGKMTIMSLTILHYGIDYLPYALRSVYPLMDALHVFYNPTPSHGHRTPQPPPETRDQLLLAAYTHDPDHKIIWHETTFTQEGPQRDSALATCKQAGADVVLVVDYDEIWSPQTLKSALEHVQKSNSAQNWLINFVHFWRSFGWVCRDNNWPVRVFDLRQSAGIGYIPRELGEIYHFGYAVKDKILTYKMACHGHKDEWRPDWYEKKWAVWPPVPDCHPTNSEGWWTPEPYNKFDLPELMFQHPFFGLERID